MKWFVRLVKAVLLPFTKAVARDVTDALDTAVLLTRDGLTSSQIVNNLEKLRLEKAENAEDLREDAKSVVDDAHRRRDNLTRGLNRWVGEVEVAAEEVNKKAARIDSEAARLAQLQSTLRNGQ